MITFLDKAVVSAAEEGNTGFPSFFIILKPDFLVAVEKVAKSSQDRTFTGPFTAAALGSRRGLQHPAGKPGKRQGLHPYLARPGQVSEKQAFPAEQC